jgi:hypothetical protein
MRRWSTIRPRKPAELAARVVLSLLAGLGEETHRKRSDTFCRRHSFFSDQISDRDVVRRGGTPGVTRACKTGSSGESGDEWDGRAALGCGPLSS